MVQCDIINTRMMPREISFKWCLSHREPFMHHTCLNFHVVQLELQCLLLHHLAWLWHGIAKHLLNMWPWVVPSSSNVLFHSSNLRHLNSAADATMSNSRTAHSMESRDIALHLMGFSVNFSSKLPVYRWNRCTNQICHHFLSRIIEWIVHEYIAL